MVDPEPVRPPVSAHPVTQTKASSTIRRCISEVRATRSARVIGTSTTRNPLLPGPVGHLDLEAVAVGLARLDGQGVQHLGMLPTSRQVSPLHLECVTPRRTSIHVKSDR